MTAPEREALVKARGPEIFSEFRCPVMSGPLSKNTEFMIYIKGQYTSSHLKNMRAIMDMVIQWLEDDEAAAQAKNTTDNSGEAAP